MMMETTRRSDSVVSRVEAAALVILLLLGRFAVGAASVAQIILGK